MRAMYSIVVIFTLLAVHLAYGQEATVEQSSPTEATSTVSDATDTEAMQKDEPVASPEPTAEPMKESSEPAFAVTTTSAPSVPPLEHHSEVVDKTDSPVSTAATKAENNATTPEGKMSTTSAPNENSAVGVTASIACLLVSVLPVIVYHS